MFSTSLVYLLVYIVFLAWYAQEQQDKEIILAKELSKTISQDIAKLILLDDLTSASDLTSALSSFATIKSMTLYTQDSTAIYRYKKDETNTLKKTTTSFSYQIDAIYGNSKLGFIKFELEKNSITDIIKEDALVLIIIYLILLLVSYMIAFYVSKQFTHPLLKLTTFLNTVELKGLRQRIYTKETDEYAILYIHINNMLDRIQKSRDAEAKIKFLQEYDALTGLANRKLFIESFQEVLDKKIRDDYGSVLCFNIRDFKAINDSYGYFIGDLLLQEIANRIKKNFKSSAMLAKIGLDEFIIWHNNLAKTEKEAESNIQDLITSILLLLKEPFDLDNQHIHISIYMGIEIYTKDSNDANSILVNADSALSAAKMQNREFAFYNKAIEKEIASRLGLYEDLLNALKNSEFELYYQLQYKDTKIYGAEALIRWNHPTKGMILPDNFISHAEKTELIIEIGYFVIEQACKQLQKWQEESLTKEWVLAINISAKHFSQDNFIEKLQFILDRYTLKREYLKIELTESLFISDTKNIQYKIQQLHDLNIKVSLDDFGTGYSSLQYLKHFYFNQVKIDQNFVVNMLKDKRDIAIIKAIIGLSETFGFEVIAEGVETKEDYQYLLSLGCHYFQGYYFAKPQRIDTLMQNLASNTL
jgi:diguanylate cyclase (GGDEF)-like protein